MGLEKKALADTHELPIRHYGDVHMGKVRSVYWLREDDRMRIIEQNGYNIPKVSELGVMIVSDRISAFECGWKGQEGLDGVPGKGAALNAISLNWLEEFEKAGIARNHVIESPHPLVWIVRKARPIRIEAIARGYITGSMWRDYAQGTREFCGNQLPEGLKENQKLPEMVLTPTTKGIIKGISGIPERDDANITRKQVLSNYRAFGFKSIGSVLRYEALLTEAFEHASSSLDSAGQILADTKLEFGYIQDNCHEEMIIIDEAVTPDSSRFWDKKAYEEGRIVENSKEGFRQFLLNALDRNVLLDKARMEERTKLADSYKVPIEEMMKASEIYRGMAKKITGNYVPLSENPGEEMLCALSKYGLVK